MLTRSRARLALVFVSLPLIAACAADSSEGDPSIANEISVNDDVDDLPNLCHDLRNDPSLLDQFKAHGYNVIHWGPGADGTNGRDIIFGTSGADHIFGHAGDDIICAGGGADFVDGGLGQDRIYGEADNDILHGRAGGDWIHGGGGNDEVYGDLLDDKLYGDEGNDLLVGGHGADHLYGGPGDDWLRGDTNGDALSGGEGEDTASFMTARPTGHAARGSRTGVEVDLAQGVAVGDGTDDLKGIEHIVGSAFDDAIKNGGSFEGSYGNDLCSGACQGKGPVPALPFVFADVRPSDTGVVVLGSKDDDNLSFAYDKGAITVTGASELHAAPPCSNVAPNVVRCTPGAPLRYLMAFGGDGKDTLTMGDGFPRDFTAHLDGGEGDDHLYGGDGEEVLFTGRTGADVLHGGPADDALITETYQDEASKPGGGGGDKLWGEDGNDQLVSDYPCGTHEYHGGAGFDIAGFARVGNRPIHATMSGKAMLIGVCGIDSATTIDNDLEVLEGSKGDDVLVGDGRDNVIWGRQGNDTLFGMGGDDVLEGHEGDDEIHGGEGRDILRGGSGFDRLYAGDGGQDRIISCGTGGGVVKTSDPSDPKPVQCTGGGSSSSSTSGGASNTCPHGSHCWCEKGANYQYAACDGYKDIAGTRGFCKLHPKNQSCDNYGSIPGTQAFCKIYPNSKYC